MAATLQRLVAVATMKESPRDPLLARVLGALFICGGILIAISLLLPHPDTANYQALRAIDAVAFLVGAAHLVGARWIPRWLIHLTLAGYSLLICLSVYFTGVAAGLYPTMFIWVVLVSAYFFSPMAVLVQCGWSWRVTRPRSRESHTPRASRCSRAGCCPRSRSLWRRCSCPGSSLAGARPRIGPSISSASHATCSAPQTERVTSLK